VVAIGTGELLKDRYRLERTLGRGGMAAVWLGHDEVLDRPVAVKVLSDTIASDPGFVARFRREATTAAGLSHPNLVGVYDFSEEGERPYLVMQFVPGENLAERLERGDGVDWDQMARELLEALAHIHDVGILHRDIKPANIIVEPEGTAKLIDFGIALPRDATALTSTGLVLGTERYAAPEVMEGRPATERSDLYSLGVVLGKCEGRCSRALGALVESLSDGDPLARPASAREALARLERREPVADEPTQIFEPTATFPAEPEPEPDRDPDPTPEPPLLSADGRTTSHRGRWGAMAALLALFAAIGVVALLAINGEDGKNGSDRPESARAQGEKSNGSRPSGTAAVPAGEAGEGSDSAAADGGETGSSEGPEPESEPEPLPASDDPETGAALNEEGFALIQAGEYEAAVPVLEEAVGAYPEGSEDLSYAYALFNLGNALRLSGRPDEAIPVLEKRLEIPNQTGTVEEELAAARAESG
jgi:eukaryotic-like serine/threonine-protein kinase